MNILDIILAIVLTFGAIQGFRKGIISQLCGVVGVVLGAWLAFKFGAKVGEWIGVELNNIVAYVIVFVVAILLAGLAGRIAESLLKVTGLGIINRLGGVVVSVVLSSLLLSLALGFFEQCNNLLHIVSPQYIEESVLSAYVEKVSDFVFPYLESAKEAVVEGVREASSAAAELPTMPTSQNL